MIFETLYESAERGELWLRDGAMCRWHLRRDGQLTIHEILVLPDRRRQGLGVAILRDLMRVDGATCIVARCPSDLQAREWYRAHGFTTVDQQRQPNGRTITTWKLVL